MNNKTSDIEVNIFRKQDHGPYEGQTERWLYSLYKNNLLLFENISYKEVCQAIIDQKPKLTDIIERYGANGQRYGEATFSRWYRGNVLDE